MPTTLEKPDKLHLLIKTLLLVIVVFLFTFIYMVTQGWDITWSFFGIFKDEEPVVSSSPFPSVPTKPMS